MGNGISSEREGLSRSPRSSSAEESPPAKRWTAARGRADGLGPSSRAESSAHQLPISSVLQEPVDGSSSSQLGGSLTAPANKKNDRPTSRNPQTPTPKRRKIHKRLEAHSGGARRRSSFVDTRPQNNTTVTPTTANESCAPVTPRIRRASPIRTTEMIVLSDSSKSNDDDLVPDFQKENLVSYEDPFSELEQLISKSAVGISRSGAGGELGGKRNGLACMNCLRRMGSSRCKKPFLGCRNQPGRGDDAPCRPCREGAQGCQQPPAALDDAAWTLQRAWERTGPLRAEAIRLAWERYSGELSDYEMREAERRSKGVHTGASSLIPFPTTAGASSRTILHSSPPTQEIAKRRVVPGMSNGRGGDNLPNREQETTLPEDQDFVGKEVFEKSRGVAPGWLDRQLFSAFDNKSPNSQYAALDVPVSSPERENRRRNGSDEGRKATKAAEFGSPNLATEGEYPAESGEPSLIKDTTETERERRQRNVAKPSRGGKAHGSRHAAKPPDRPAGTRHSARLAERPAMPQNRPTPDEWHAMKQFPLYPNHDWAGSHFLEGSYIPGWPGWKKYMEVQDNPNAPPLAPPYDPKEFHKKKKR